MKSMLQILIIPRHDKVNQVITLTLPVVESDYSRVAGGSRSESGGGLDLELEKPSVCLLTRQRLLQGGGRSMYKPNYCSVCSDIISPYS
ncbi:hypothetical protein J6590_076699 [Homalodisca vitripennis]|nr:hypothetical protein J6590_076699 [Homalodisca vitripennis]